MFVLHSSSCCDVCLEGFNGSGDMAPHAIPCGHVFCKTCLEAVIPPRCPLCRKQYDPARLKRLHVDRPEGHEDPKEAELLQRIALSFDAPHDQLLTLLQEVDVWLSHKPIEASIALRKARLALDNYQRMRSDRIRDVHYIRRLNEDLNTLRATMDEEKRRAHLVEEGLLKVKDTLTIEVDRYKSELASLQSEIERRTLKNPLPPPPEPVSFPRYPPFDPKFAHPNGPFWHSQPAFTSSHIPPYPYGQPGQSSQLWPDSERENYSHLLREPANGTTRDRKGKSKDSTSRPSTSNGVNGVNGHESSKAAPSTNGLGTNDTDYGFFSRRTPPSLPSVTTVPEVSQLLQTGLDPYSLAAMLVPEYMNGYTEGFASAIRPPDPSSSHASLAADTNTMASSTKSGSSSERKKRREEREKEKEEERRERRRKREAERERRQERERTSGESRRQEHRRERRMSTVNGHDGATTSTRSSSRPATRGAEEPGSVMPQVAPRPPNAEGEQRSTVRRRESLAEILTDNHPRSRRPSVAGPPTATPVAPPPAAVETNDPSPPVRVVRLLAPTPRAPIQLFEPPDSAENGRQSPSRQTLNTVSTWGTVDTSRSAHSNNSSLNIGEVHNFNRYSRDHQWTRPAATPYRLNLELEPEESSGDEEEESEGEDENQEAPLTSRPSQAAPQTSSAPTPGVASTPASVNRHHRFLPGVSTSEPIGTRHQIHHPRSATTHPPPTTAPAHHGSRHTQMVTVPTHQNPSAHQQLHAAAIPSGGTTPSHSGPQGQDRRRGHGHSHSQPHTPNLHPRSQQSAHGDSNTRARSGSSAGIANASTPSLTSSNMNGRVPPHSAPATRPTPNQQESESDDDEESSEEEDDEEHETAAANALGLVSAPPAAPRTRNVPRHSNSIPIVTPQGPHVNTLGLALPPSTGSIPISSPTPRPTNRQSEFLRTFSQT